MVSSAGHTRPSRLMKTASCNTSCYKTKHHEDAELTSEKTNLLHRDPQYQTSLSDIRPGSVRQQGTLGCKPCSKVLPLVFHRRCLCHEKTCEVSGQWTASIPLQTHRPMPATTCRSCYSNSEGCAAFQLEQEGILFASPLLLQPAAHAACTLCTTCQGTEKLCTCTPAQVNTSHCLVRTS